MATENTTLDINVRILNAICKPTNFPPFKIWTHLDYRFPLYKNIMIIIKMI